MDKAVEKPAAILTLDNIRPVIREALLKQKREAEQSSAGGSKRTFCKRRRDHCASSTSTSLPSLNKRTSSISLNCSESTGTSPSSSNSTQNTLSNQNTSAKSTPTKSSNKMSSQNRRPPRSSGRGGAHEAGEEGQLWRQITQQLAVIQNGETKAKELGEAIFLLEKQIKDKELAGGKRTSEQIDKLDQLYRENLRVAEDQKAYLAENFTGPDGSAGTLHEKIQLLKGLVEHSEQNAEAGSGRASSSRSAALDADTRFDSPGPSTLDNKHVRKSGNGRIGSQPPRSSDATRGDATPAEGSERSTGKPKIVFQLREEVCFKPKSDTVNDWILGIVTRVIGEGKSRRYDVKDPAPDPDVLAKIGKNGEVIYKSSASSMVPIPVEGTVFADYEKGRQVLALYPETTTFYRAEIMETLDGGANVRVLFEDESMEMLKVVERRMVLDHRG